MTEWLGWLRDVAGKEPSALVSIVASEGSAPRGAGTRMLVTADALQGTIGGGQLEFRAVEQARTILAHPPGSWRVQDYPLGPLLGQCCGGRVRLLVEHVDPADLGWIADATEERILVSTFMTDRVARHVNDHAMPSGLSARGDRPRAGDSLAEIIGQHRRPLYLFGAGHVGQAIARHAANLPFRLSWFDTRPVFETIEGVAVVPEAAIEQCVADAPDDAAILILTHDHGLDYRLTHAALRRPPCAFIGLIGSATKRARFHARLERDGIDAPSRSRLTSPIGVAGVTGKEPDVIAIAVLAQLLQLRIA
ncbi:xanthine dehydrogenase accessory protein XdhC [Sphingobium sp. BYY-5]|uniref:xanthine dehydrogenase accessory protein XdhC n=1 Tax=Sphingobium sp. BYY-5 TaxID=2926400 RepID=UPI001FA7EBD5|nr:xanthine dehydrogenase accessory protein XdhC [Sphingobium sp. BYY-5]MCI4592580.1 xanthine dehydrogenase accessory protein XdhC [Sphingobium sp. BYY-5]